jgi:hypothetical protein
MAAGCVGVRDNKYGSSCPKTSFSIILDINAPKVMNNIEIDDFPSEVWARVLLNLSTNDFLAVMQASKRLRAMCASNYIQKSVFAVIREKSTKHGM